MNSNNSMQNDTLINTIQSDIVCIQTELNKALYTVDKLRNELSNKKKTLLNICPHTDKIRKREDGPYGERYWYCDKCKLEF